MLIKHNNIRVYTTEKMSQKQISYEKKLQLIELGMHSTFKNELNIFLVRQRPCLWDVRDEKFIDNPFKANVWKEVSAELGEDLEGIFDFWTR